MMFYWKFPLLLKEKLIDDHTLVALKKRCIGMTILKSIWDGKVLEKYFVVVSWLWEILQKSQNYRKLINLENQFNKTLVGLSLSPPCHTRHPRSS